jgi:hypothetical protein
MYRPIVLYRYIWRITDHDVEARVGVGLEQATATDNCWVPAGSGLIRLKIPMGAVYGVHV